MNTHNMRGVYNPHERSVNTLYMKTLNISNACHMVRMINVEHKSIGNTLLIIRNRSLTF